jgi:hypothetical protein
MTIGHQKMKKHDDNGSSLGNRLPKKILKRLFQNVPNGGVDKARTDEGEKKTKTCPPRDETV